MKEESQFQMGQHDHDNSLEVGIERYCSHCYDHGRDAGFQEGLKAAGKMIMLAVGPNV